MTPAMKAGIPQYPMTIDDIFQMPPLRLAMKRWTYKKRAS
jgi:hypothetical protein